MMRFAPLARPSGWIGRPVLQRRCAGGDNCSGCHGLAPPSVAHALASPGRPLPAEQRAALPHHGIDLSLVRIHADETAAAAARDVAAEAFTVGRDIFFGAGRWQPRQPTGQALLAHEVTHVGQQGAAIAYPGQPVPLHPGGDAAERQAELGLPATPLGGTALQRKPEVLGTAVTDPKGVKPPFKGVTATFDGATFTANGDGKTILTANGQSGRPYTVRPADAKACGGKADDSYMNNPRYVGIADNGPLPEGEYSFQRNQMVAFSTSEQAKMSLADPGSYVDPHGGDVHGDWGAARAPLHPVKLVPAKHCGSTGTRSGFYLHGGTMPGSSGCIDIGNGAVADLVARLAGYTASVKLTVKYTAPAPDIGWLDRAAGRFMYPGKKKSGMWDRLKSLGGVGDDE
jgi:hypothetical protein